MFDFANSSKGMLKTVHPDLKKVCEEVKKYSEIDFDISCGYRSVNSQQELFKLGRSQLDGIRNKSKHNLQPAEAVDVYCYSGSRASYAIHQMSYLSGIFHTVSERLFAGGQIHYKIRWGGNWDQDGELLTDQEFDDLPHFEIIQP